MRGMWAHDRERRVWLAMLAMLLLLPMLAFAQGKPLSAYYREVWTTRQGLPHNQINAIAQSPDGYLWLGTWEGLVRYNGQEFVLYDRNSVPELQDNGIRSVRVAPNGDIVVGTSRGGVTVRHGDHWTTWRIEDGLAQDEIMDAVFDRRGRLWAATESGGVSRIGKDRRAKQFNTKNGLPSDAVFSLHEDRDGSMWVATARGLVRIVGDRVIAFGAESGLPAAPMFTQRRLRSGEYMVGTERGLYRRIGDSMKFELVSPLLPIDGIPSFDEDAAGGLWVGTVNHGLLRLFNGHLDRLTSDQDLPNNRVPSLLVDREGSVWVGTNAGLLRLSDAPFSTWNSRQGMSDDYVRTVYEAHAGGIWVGTGHGLNLWRNGRVVETHSSRTGMPSDSILSLLEARDGSLLVGTYTDGVQRMRDGKVLAHYSNENGMPGSNQVRALAEDQAGNLWFGTTRGLVRFRDGKYRVFRQADGLPRDFIISLHAARNGVLWIGTSDGAATITGDKITSLNLRRRDGAQDVFGFHEDTDGTIWMATDRGLVRYKNGQLQSVGRANGLPVDTLFAVVDDHRGAFWLTSNRGVYRIERKQIDRVLAGAQQQLQFDHFGEADGLISAQCNGGSGPAALLDRVGNLWVATARGVATVSPGNLRAFRHPLPKPIVEQVLANDVPVAKSSVLTLPPGTNKLEFRYAAVSFVMPQFLRYRYRLRGVDHDWVDHGNQRSVQYTNLKAGHYQFEVAVSAPGLGQTWSKTPVVVELTIAPRLWERQSVIWGMVILLLLLFIGGYRWWIGTLRARAADLERQVEERTRDVRLQSDRLRESDAEKSRLLEQLHQQSMRFERMALEDALTGIANRRNLDAALAHAVEASVHAGTPLAFALFDIDKFKRINDSYSHSAGDQALIAVAAALQATFGSAGMVARWGGEEFGVMLVDATFEQAHTLCEQALARVAQIDTSQFAPNLQITVSAGVVARAGEVRQEALVSRADALLYQAKRSGRNRVCG